MRPRRIILKIHLYLGLTGAIFIAILGLTGSVIAFETDIDRWLRPALWHGKSGAALPEDQLIAIANQRFPPAQVTTVTVLPQPDLSHVLQMSDDTTVYIDPHDGAILGRVPTNQKPVHLRIMTALHQIHTGLIPDSKWSAALARIGGTIVKFAGLIVTLMVPTGIILWWRAKKVSIRWSASWFRICLDAHQAIGIIAALFLMLASCTGVLIGFSVGQEAFYALTHSSRPGLRPPPQSTPAAGASRISLQQALASGWSTAPMMDLSSVQSPRDARAAFVVSLRSPGETWEPTIEVFIDQYSGKVLEVRNPKTDFPGFWAIRQNRSLHTGDFWGLPGHILMSAASLAMAALAMSGVVIWWKKLAF